VNGLLSGSLNLHFGTCNSRAHVKNCLDLLYFSDNDSIIDNPNTTARPRKMVNASLYAAHPQAQHIFQSGIRVNKAKKGRTLEKHIMV